MYHCFGCVLASLSSFLVGATLVFPSESFDPVKVVSAIHKYQGTVLYGVPTMMLEVLNASAASAGDASPNKEGITTLRCLAMGGSPCPSTLVARLIQELKVSQFIIAFGMTETSPVSFSTDTSDAKDIVCNTVGRVTDHVEAKVVETKSGKTVPIGEVGEIAVKGYSVMQGD